MENFHESGNWSAHIYLLEIEKWYAQCTRRFATKLENYSLRTDIFRKLRKLAYTRKIASKFGIQELH